MLVVRQEAITILGTSVLMPRRGQGEAHTFYRRQGLDVWKMVASKTLVAVGVALVFGAILVFGPTLVLGGPLVFGAGLAPRPLERV